MSYSYAEDDEDAYHFQEGEERALEEILESENEEEDRIDDAIGSVAISEDAPIDPFIEAKSKIVSVNKLMDMDKEFTLKLDAEKRTRTRFIPNIPEKVRQLAKVSRDLRGRIIDDKHKTLPILTKYERTGIISERASLLQQGQQSVLSDLPPGLSYSEIAERELLEKVIPIIVVRELPSGRNEYWHLEDLLDLRY